MRAGIYGRTDTTSSLSDITLLLRLSFPKQISHPAMEWSNTRKLVLISTLPTAFQLGVHATVDSMNFRPCMATRFLHHEVWLSPPRFILWRQGMGVDKRLGHEPCAARPSSAI